MRLLIDILTALTLAILISGTLWLTRQQEAEEAGYEELQAAVELIQQQVLVHGALEQVARTPQGYPERIDPSWFEDELLPVNALLSGAHPWLEIAWGADLDADHPTHRVADDPSLAGFWYNPRRGIVRARVPRQLSDKATLALYNRVNQTSLEDLRPLAIEFDADLAEKHAEALKQRHAGSRR